MASFPTIVGRRASSREAPTIPRMRPSRAPSRTYCFHRGAIDRGGTVTEELASSMRVGSGYFTARVSRITWITRAVSASATAVAIAGSLSVTERSTIPELPIDRTDTPRTKASADRSAPTL